MSFDTIVTSAGEFNLYTLAVTDPIRAEDVANYGVNWAMETLKRKHAEALANEILEQGLGEQYIEYDIARAQHLVATTIRIATRRR